MKRFSKEAKENVLLDAPAVCDALGNLFSWGRQELEILGSEEAQVSAEWILAETTGLHRSQIYLEMDRIIPRNLVAKFRLITGQRKNRIPLAYILGKTFFRDEVLEVKSGCLIPRPETEILVEKFIENSGFEKSDSFSFLDLGTGSGAIGISVLRHFLKAQATFSDGSPRALRAAKKNVEHYRLSCRVEMMKSDLFSGLGSLQWDAILCNPPYLAEADWVDVEPEILHEPREALDGGFDGLYFYREIAKSSRNYLKEKGWLVLEVGVGQAETVSSLLEENGFSNIRCFKDHAGIDRVIMAQG